MFLQYLVDEWAMRAAQIFAKGSLRRSFVLIHLEDSI
jgi:hypothetical protein